MLLNSSKLRTPSPFSSPSEKRDLSLCSIEFCLNNTTSITSSITWVDTCRQDDNRGWSRSFRFTARSCRCAFLFYFQRKPMRSLHPWLENLVFSPAETLKSGNTHDVQRRDENVLLLILTISFRVASRHLGRSAFVEHHTVTTQIWLYLRPQSNKWLSFYPQINANCSVPFTSPLLPHVAASKLFHRSGHVISRRSGDPPGL